MTIFPLFIYIKKIFYFWLGWVCVAVHRLSLVAESEGSFLVVVLRLLIVVASLVMKHKLRVCGFQ